MFCSFVLFGIKIGVINLLIVWWCIDARGCSVLEVTDEAGGY